MEKDSIKANIILAVIFLSLSLWMIFFAIPSEISSSATWSIVDSGVNSRTFPYFASIIMGAAALVQLAVTVRKYVILKKQNQKTDGGIIEWKKELRAIAVFLACILYGILFVTIGYIFATIIIPPIILFILGDRKWPHYAVVYGVGTLMYFIFQFLLKIRLP